MDGIDGDVLDTPWSMWQKDHHVPRSCLSVGNALVTVDLFAEACFLSFNRMKVDQVGRKPFLLWGAVAFTCGLLLLSAGFALKSPIASFTACCVLVAAYSVSFGPLTWLVTAEMYPPAIRGKALGFGQVRLENSSERLQDAYFQPITLPAVCVDKMEFDDTKAT